MYDFLKKHITKCIFFVVIAMVSTGCLKIVAKNEEPVIEGSKFVMDTVVNVKLYAGGSEDILNQMFEKLEEIDRLMSLKYETSDISQINLNAGYQMITISEETKDVIEKSIVYSELSEGYFDITFGPLIKLWDIKAVQPRVPEEKEIEHALKEIDYRKIMIQDSNIMLENNAMSIDLGGIAKGYAADEIKEIATNQGVTSGIINLGGNILVIGSKISNKKDTFSIGIQNPFSERNGYLGIVNVKDQSVVTSGNYERYFEIDGQRYHHILSKDTGYPVDNGIAAVSIVTKISIDADALSTVLYILGIEKGIALVESLEQTECLYITNNKEIMLSSGMKDLFVLTDKQFKIVQVEGVK